MAPWRVRSDPGPTRAPGTPRRGAVGEPDPGFSYRERARGPAGSASPGSVRQFASPAGTPRERGTTRATFPPVAHASLNGDFRRRTPDRGRRDDREVQRRDRGPGLDRCGSRETRYPPTVDQIEIRRSAVVELTTGRTAPPLPR